MTKSNLGSKGFLFGSQVTYSTASRNSMQEPRGGSCLLEFHTMTKCCLPALFPWLVQGGSARSGLRPPTSVINGKNKKQNLPPHTQTQTSICSTGLFADLHTLTQELPPHTLWIRMSQNTGMWGPLGKRAVQNATCTLGERLAFRREVL